MDQKKFIAFSLSDIIRDEAKKRGLDPARDNLIAIGNELRETEGPGTLAKRTIEKIRNAPQAVVDSIRNPSEIEELRKNLKDFRLIGVTAGQKVRFERAMKRARAGDGLTFEEFAKKEEKENSTDPKAQQLSACFQMADFTVDNSGSLEDLKRQIDGILQKLNYKPYARPTWDEYFMKMAFLVAERSTCLRHHVGAVIVRDNRIVSSGYNGAPSGVKDCTELGCLRDQLGIKSGTRHEVCRAVHAEQNAIIQASQTGSVTTGGTIYCTHSPCVICAKMVVNARIKRFVTCGAYPDTTYQDLFREAGVKFDVIPRPPLAIGVLD